MTANRSPGRPSGRPPWVFAASAAGAAVLVLAAIVTGVMLTRPDDATTTRAAATAAPGTEGTEEHDVEIVDGTITLTDANTVADASCIVPSAESMREFNDLAFEGHVQEVSKDSALFAVDRWYTGGGSATAVRLKRKSDLPGLLYTPDLAVGKRYLILAEEGTIGYCDPSGPWTPQLEQLYREAFGAGRPVTG